MDSTPVPSRRLRTAIVGLGFGAEFIPIHQRHPQVELVAICQRSADTLQAVGRAHHVERCYSRFADVLADRDIDAVHVNSPIPDHAAMTIAALEAGKHVMCTVPMATSVADCRRIVELTARTGLRYMMAETVVYAREFLFVRDLAARGELGRIQFLQASHQQDMDGWPDYWPGLPPMWYATHCVSPCLAILGKHADSVVCHGSGRIREELISRYGSSFALETATFKIRDSDVVAEVTRSLFDTARQYRESFDVTGSKKSFEWQQVENEEPIIHTKGLPEPKIPQRVKVPDYAQLLPEPIRRFTQPAAIQDAEHLSFIQGGGHGGSHPHLAHAFLSAVRGDRPALPDAATSANWTMVGICAHQSAMKGGERVKIPEL
jgi:predicted dehydrogenase